MGGGRPNRDHEGRRAETIIFGSPKHLGVEDGTSLDVSYSFL